MLSPLQTIQMTALYLARLDAGEAVSSAAQRPVDGGARVQGLLEELTDFNRANLCLGVRVPPGTLARLFEPLHRGQETRNQHGLGLGLYIVREIARAHGGRVEASLTDDSTVFTVWLPKAARPARTSTAGDDQSREASA